jgi:hypothetical protein
MASFCVLINIIFLKRDFTDETKNLLEDFFSDTIRLEESDGKNTGHANDYLGRLHQMIAIESSCNETMRDHIQLAESYSKEALRIFMKHYHPNHPNVLSTVSRLSLFRQDLKIFFSQDHPSAGK